MEPNLSRIKKQRNSTKLWVMLKTRLEIGCIRYGKTSCYLANNPCWHAMPRSLRRFAVVLIFTRYEIMLAFWSALDIDAFLV